MALMADRSTVPTTLGPVRRGSLLSLYTPSLSGLPKAEVFASVVSASFCIGSGAASGVSDGAACGVAGASVAAEGVAVFCSVRAG